MEYFLIAKKKKKKLYKSSHERNNKKRYTKRSLSSELPFLTYSLFTATPIYKEFI